MKKAALPMLFLAGVLLHLFQTTVLLAQRLFHETTTITDQSLLPEATKSDLQVVYPGNCGEAITFTYRGQQVTYGTVLIDYGGDIG